MNQEIKIRYNTEKDKTDPNLPAWRVLVDGVEKLAESVEIKTFCWTTQDEISPGVIKWHISCSGAVSWDGKICKIENESVAGVIWLTGLPASGKSTLAKAVATKLRSLGHKVEELDGDAIRDLFPNTGFSRTDRDQHIRRIGYMASRLEAQGVIVVASLVSPFADSRLFVKNICKNYFEIFVSTPLEICEKRDPKGLYKKARAGEIQFMTGVNDPYEIPVAPQLSLNTGSLGPEAAADEILKAFL